MMLCIIKSSFFLRARFCESLSVAGGKNFRNAEAILHFVVIYVTRRAHFPKRPRELFGVGNVTDCVQLRLKIFEDAVPAVPGVFRVFRAESLHFATQSIFIRKFALCLILQGLNRTAHDGTQDLDSNFSATRPPLRIEPLSLFARWGCKAIALLAVPRDPQRTSTTRTA